MQRTHACSPEGNGITKTSIYQPVTVERRSPSAHNVRCTDLGRSVTHAVSAWARWENHMTGHNQPGTGRQGERGPGPSLSLGVGRRGFLKGIGALGAAGIAGVAAPGLAGISTVASRTSAARTARARA